MAITITINGSVTLDETAGTQVGGSATTNEDNNDSDISLATLQTDASSFYARLNTLLLDPDGAFGFARSANNYIALSGTGTITSLGFTNASGGVLPVLGSGTGAACNLTALDGGAITLFQDASLGSSLVYGVDSTGDIVFAMYMKPNAGLTAAEVWMVQFEPMDNPVDTNHDDPLAMTGLGVGAGVSSEFNFAGLPSGQNLFGMVGSTTSALIVIGKTPVLNPDGTFTNASNTINTSQGGGNTTIGVNNQMFDPGEGAYFTYVRHAVSNFIGTNLDAGEADNANNMQYTDGDNATNDTIEVDSAFLKVAQLQGGGLATMSIAAFNIDGSPQGDDLIPASGDNPVAITRVVVYAADGTTVLEDSSLAGPQNANIVITFGTGTGAGGNGIPVGAVRISGVDSKYKIEWFTDGVHDQVLVSGVAGKFDIGGFGINEPSGVSVPLTGVRFEDDGPAVNLVLNGSAELRLDETDNDADDLAVGGILATNSLAAAAYLTTNDASFGTDGEAGASPTVWSLALTGANAAGVDSGLDDAATNGNVMLFVVNSTTIVGKAGGPDGPVVMTITIDDETGELTVVQDRAVEHNDPLDHDEDGLSSAMMNSGLVAAVRTVTDGDGDSANDSVDVSQVIKLEDDGPAVNLVLNGSAELRLDETDNDADDLAVGGILATNSLAAAAYLTTNDASFGTDGEAGASPTVWSLALTGANAAGVDSGLDDAATNGNVMLFVVNSTTIVGKAGGPDGPVVMTITIDDETGELTVVQDRAVEHNDPLDHDEDGLSSAMMNSGLVAAVRTVTDGDGDSANDSVDVSQVIKLEDDGPDTTLDLKAGAEVRVDESLGQNGAPETEPAGSLGRVTVLSAVLFEKLDAFGSDGPGATASDYALVLSEQGADSGLKDSDTGSSVLLYNIDSDTVVGRVGGIGGAEVFRASINSAGDVTLDQSRAMVHGDPLDHDEADTYLSIASGKLFAERTITDGDGDQDKDPADLGPAIRFEDDGPVVDIELKGGAEVTVDETGLPASDSITAANLFQVNTAAFGSDGEGATSSVYRLLLSDDQSGLFDTATGEEVLLSINAAGTLITGEVNDGVSDVTVFTIALDPDTGTVTLTQNRALVHDDADHDEANSPLTLPAELVRIQRTITDGDEDSDDDDVDISQIFKFEDDGPVLLPPSQDPLDLTTDDTDITDDDTLSTDDIFPTTPDFGSDGPHATDPLDFELSLATENGNSGLVDTATGKAVLLATVGADIVGYVDADGNGSLSAGEKIASLEAIRYSLAEDDADSSTVTFTQSRSVVHANVNDPDEAGFPERVAFNLVMINQIAIDGDDDVSDVVSFDLGAITFIKDDGPSIGPISDGLVDFAMNDFVTNSLNGAVGNDPNSTPYILTAHTAGLTINGVDLQGVLAGNSQSVTYYADTNGNNTFGDAGDTAYYRLELGDQSGEGDYTFTVLVNPPPAFTDFDFTYLPSGQSLFGVLVDQDENGVQFLDGLGLLVVGRDAVINDPGNGSYTNASDTINTSQGGGAVTIGVDNQMFDPGDGAIFVYVDNPDDKSIAINSATGSGGLTQTSADDADTLGFAGTVPSRAGEIEVVQKQGGGALGMRISAYDVDVPGADNTIVSANDPQSNNPPTTDDVSQEARDFIEDPLAGGSRVSITTVNVYDRADPTNILESVVNVNGTAVNVDGDGDGVIDNSSITVTFTLVGGAYVATVLGFTANDTIAWGTAADHDAVLIEGTSGKWDVGGFNIAQGNPTPDQLLEFTAQVTDGDGDTDSASWKIGIDGTGIHDDDFVTGISII